MQVVGHVRVDMKPVKHIMARLGIDARGDVQKFHTANVLRRIQKYMPYRTGATIHLMMAQSPVHDPLVRVTVPYARMLYYGKVMVDPVTGAVGFLTENGWRSRRGVPKVVSDRDIQYDKTKNPRAGPFWDRRLVASEGNQMSAELYAYVRRRGRH